MGALELIGQWDSPRELEIFFRLVALNIDWNKKMDEQTLIALRPMRKIFESLYSNDDILNDTNIEINRLLVDFDLSMIHNDDIINYPIQLIAKSRYTNENEPLRLIDIVHPILKPWVNDG